MKLPYFLRRSYIACAAAVVAAALSANGFAAPIISFNPVTQNVNIGDTAVVALQISGLTANTAPALGAWAVNIGFDPAIVAINFLAGDVVFGLGLNPAGEPPSDQGSNPSGPGVLNLFEVAFADPLVLAGAQGDTFTLATLSFKALAQGVSPLTAAFTELSDQNGAAITGFQTNTGSIVVGNVIPEPGTATFAVALVVTALTDRRRKSRA